jgi:phosphorylated adapter RNA export protein
MHVSSSQSQYTNVRPTPPALRSIGAKLEHVELDPTVSCDMLADQLSSILHETNIELLRRCTRVVGNVACIALLRRVEAVELAGGMTTLDGRRRRTPGGVYLYLLRQDNMDTVTEAQLVRVLHTLVHMRMVCL